MNVLFLRLHLVIFLFSFTGIIIKHVNAPVMTLIWLRMFIAALSLFIFLQIKRISLKLPLNLFFFILLGGICMTLNWLCFFYAIKISNVSIVLSTIPLGALFTCFLEPIFFKKPFRLYQIVLALIMSICILVIFYQVSENQLIGLLFGLLASFFSSLAGVVNTFTVRKSKKTQVISFYQMLTGVFIISILFVFYVDFFWKLAEINLKDWILLIILGSFFTAYIKVKVLSLMRKINPYTFQLNVNIEPVYGILMAYLLFGESEKMSIKFYLCIFIMLLSIFFNQKLSKKAAI